MCKVPEGMKKATTCLGNRELGGPHGGWKKDWNNIEASLESPGSHAKNLKSQQKEPLGTLSENRSSLGLCPGWKLKGREWDAFILVWDEMRGPWAWVAWQEPTRSHKVRLGALPLPSPSPPSSRPISLMVSWGNSGPHKRNRKADVWNSEIQAEKENRKEASGQV